MNATASQQGSPKHDRHLEPQSEDQGIRPWDDFVTYVRHCVRQEPEVAACVCLGIGFILGWRLKPW